MATQIQAQSEAVRTLTALDSVPVSMLALLTQAPDDSSEYAARIIFARSLAGQSVAELAAQLVARQNMDGGFGGAAGYASNPLDTALALQALVVSGSSDAAAITRAKLYLISRQDTSGGFGFEGNPVSVYVTALVSRSLQQGVPVTVMALFASATASRTSNASSFGVP
jgi:hypothetical protein